MWNTIGHCNAISYLQMSLEKDRLSHALLITGPIQIGKMCLATDIARAANCLEDDRPCDNCNQCERISKGVHTDLRVIGLGSENSPTADARSSVGIEQVRDIQREANLKPYEGRYRVFIIDHSELLTIEAANSLLKLLENPPVQVLLIFLAINKESLPATVVSRCQRVELRPVSTKEIVNELLRRFRVDKSQAMDIASLSQGRPGWALTAVSEPQRVQEVFEELDVVESLLRSSVEKRFDYAKTSSRILNRDRESGLIKLSIWESWFRDVLLLKHGVPEFATYQSRLSTLHPFANTIDSTSLSDVLRSIRNTARLIDRNVNAQLAMESLMLTLPCI